MLKFKYFTLGGFAYLITSMLVVKFVYSNETIDNAMEIYKN